MINFSSTFLYLLTTLAFSCDFPERDLPNWTMLESGTQCAIEEPQQVVLKSTAELEAFWEEAFSGIDMSPQVPSVDFDKKWVVGAFLGMKRKGGFSIEVQSVAESDNNLDINLLTQIPGPNCITTMAIEFPYIFFSINQVPNKEVQFTIEEKIINCD